MIIKEITTQTEWQNLLEITGRVPALVLKHSTRCPISASALREYEAFCMEFQLNVGCYLVKVIESRGVSNAMAEDTGVSHQSPQMHLIQNGITIWNVSHRSITREQLKDALKRFL